MRRIIYNQKSNMKSGSLIYLFLLFLNFGFVAIAAPTQKQTLFLSGTDNTHTKTWEFFCTSGRNSGVWSKIEVPSHWEQQGFVQICISDTSRLEKSEGFHCL